MKLIDLYIQEVTRRLPEKMRMDIALELRSTIEDMLPEEYSEKEVKEVLNELGNPAVLASGYKDQPMHLIGPRYFDLYVSLLKLIIPIVAAVALIAAIPEYFIKSSGEEGTLTIIFTIIGVGIGTIFEVGVQVFFWLTLTFVVIERVENAKNQQPITSSMKKWTADDLKNVAYIPKKKAISKVEVFGSLLWTAIWATFYFKAYHLVGVYEEGKNGLELVVPALNQDVLLQYWPIIVLIIVGEIALVIFKLIKEQWTRSMAIFNAILHLIATVTLIIIMTDSNVLTDAFITYITDLFEMTKGQFNLWIVGTIIGIFIVSSGINAYDGFSKARIREVTDFKL